jgi:hypothetical protein
LRVENNKPSYGQTIINGVIINIWPDISLD